MELIEFYRNNPVIAAEDLLNVDLDTPQKYVLQEMWFKPYTIVTAGRGCGKSFLLSVVSALYSMLYSGRKVLIMSPSFRQCVVGDTLMLTSNGFERAQDVSSEVAFVHSGFDKRVCKATYNNYADAIVKIKTSLGFTIAGAKDHKILVATEEENKCVYAPIGTLNIDDKVLLCAGTGVFGNTDIDAMSAYDEWYASGVIELPDWVYTANKKTFVSFVRAIFSDFGWMSNDSYPKIVFTYPDKKALDDLRIMLLNMGIVFAEEREYTIATASPVDFGLFIDLVGFVSEEPGLINEAYEEAVSFSGYELSSNRGTRCVFADNLGIRYLADKVVSIEHGFDFTYDFTIDVDESYVSNGFISHNSKMVFDELKKRYSNSPILREVAKKKPVVGADKCYLHFKGAGEFTGSSIEAYPLGSGDTIRGLRGHFILVDEFAQVPEDIFEVVIRPMGATTTTPMENVRRLQALKQKVAQGLLTAEEYKQEVEGMQTNKIVGVTSAYYQFNHVYKRIQAYTDEINKGSDKYSVVYISYEDMSEGFLESSNIDEAKATMTKSEFNMEYRAVWESDSEGLFKASIIDSVRNPACQVKTAGTKGEKYVFGIDPARSSDSFAIVGIEVGNPAPLIYAFSAVGLKFPKMANVIQELCYDKFEAICMYMDAGAGGGGVAIKDILSNKHFSEGRMILDVDDQDHDGLVGKRILHMHVPNSSSVAELNYNALNLLEQGRIQFPYPPTDFSEAKDKVFAEVTTMVKQMTSVTMTETKSGNVKFDIPASGKGSRKKDLYSAFLLAAKALQDVMSSEREDTSYVNRGGLIVPVSRVSMGPSLYNI